MLKRSRPEIVNSTLHLVMLRLHLVMLRLQFSRISAVLSADVRASS